MLQLQLECNVSVRHCKERTSPSHGYQDDVRHVLVIIRPTSLCEVLMLSSCEEISLNFPFQCFVLCCRQKLHFAWGMKVIVCTGSLANLFLGILQALIQRNSKRNSLEGLNWKSNQGQQRNSSICYFLSTAL